MAATRNTVIVLVSIFVILALLLIIGVFVPSSQSDDIPRTAQVTPQEPEVFVPLSDDTPQPTSPTPIALFHFDEPFRVTSFANAVGGTTSCRPERCPTTGQPGLQGNALEFNGGGDFIPVGMTGLSPQQGTITMWVKLNARPKDQAYLFGHTTWPAYANRIQLYVKNGALSVGMGDRHNEAENIVALPTHEWFHLALRWNGGTYTVFYNGERVHGGAYQGLITLNDVADIGNNGDLRTRDEAIPGLIDEVALYDTALYDAEIKELYEAGGHPQPVTL